MQVAVKDQFMILQEAYNTKINKHNNEKKLQECVELARQTRLFCCFLPLHKGHKHIITKIKVICILFFTDF